MRLSNRLQIGTYWNATTPGMSFALTGAPMLKEAFKAGRAVNISAYRADAEDRAGSDPIASHPLGLSSRIVFDTTYNVLGAWVDQLHGFAYLKEFTKYFANDVYTMGHTYTGPGSYQTGASAILENSGFTVRFLLNDAPNSDELENWFTLDWGGTDRKWQFIKSQSSTALAQRSATWTQEAESALFVLLAIKSPSDAQITEIEALRTALYTDYTRLSIQGDKWKDGTIYEVTFIPERMGKVAVYEKENFIGEVNCTAILKTRAAGTLWTASKLAIHRNAGHYFWQLGYPEFASNGSLTFPYKVGDYDHTNAVHNEIKDEPTGTAITFTDTVDDPDNPVWGYLTLTFTTTNRRITPMLYAAHAHLAAGLRTITAGVWLDTDNFAESPVMNVTTSFDGECRRGQHTVDVRDINGTTFDVAATGDEFFHHDTCENRIANLWIGGAQVLSTGIVKAATARDMASATDGTDRADLTHAWSGATLVLCDQWLILEEYEMFEGELVGDELTLGEYVIRALRLVGIGGSAATAGIEDGPLLPVGVPGERWAIMSPACTLADHLTQIVERYGLGMSLWVDGEGVWNLARRDTDLAQVGGVDAVFTSTAGATTTYPGRLVMQAPLDWERNTEEFYNVIPVVGASDSNARLDSGDDPEQPISYVWVQYESITHDIAGARSKLFIGRRKAMAPVVDTGLRTFSDVNRVARSLALKYCKPPMYVGFKTFYHYGIFIGSRITCDGVDCEVVRVSGANVEADSMYILARVVIP